MKTLVNVNKLKNEVTSTILMTYKAAKKLLEITYAPHSIS